MADNDQLGAFLAGTPQEPAEAPAAPEPQHDTPAEPKAPTAKPEAAAKAPEPEPEPEDDAGVDGGTMVPFGALEKARNARNDWKSKAAALDAEARLLRQQVEDFKRQPPMQQAPPPQAPPQMFVAPPDFTQDPHGWAQAMVQNQQRALLNERLNFSEAQISDKIGADELGKYVTEFKEAATKDQTLWGKLYSQPNPYAWMTKHMDLLRQQADIGDDPAAYRARVVAEERAKWEAELQAQPAQGNGAPRVSPAANLPPSLAGVRSVAGRSSPAFTGPPPLDALFPGHNNRQRTQH